MKALTESLKKKLGNKQGEASMQGPGNAEMYLAPTGKTKTKNRKDSETKEEAGINKKEKRKQQKNTDDEENVSHKKKKKKSRD